MRQGPQCWIVDGSNPLWRAAERRGLRGCRHCPAGGHLVLGAANHAFRDGNKRTAVVLLRSFLNLNGFDMTLSEDEIFELAIGVADAHLSVDNVEAKLRPAVLSL